MAAAFTDGNRSFRYIRAISSRAARSSADSVVADGMSLGFQPSVDCIRYAVASAAGSLTVPSACSTLSRSTLGMIVLEWYRLGSRSQL